MGEENVTIESRRQFLRACGRGTIVAGLGLLTGLLLARRQVSGCGFDGDCENCADKGSCTLSRTFRKRNTIWVIDREKCTKCGRCATDCVLKMSAVKCFHTYSMCGYCKLCFGYFQPGSAQLTEAAENQVCPTGAIKRKFVEPPYYEYSIDKDLCNGCGKCVDGCNAFGNGSLHLQVDQDICLNCNECAIARNCPGEAFSRITVGIPLEG